MNPRSTIPDPVFSYPLAPLLRDKIVSQMNSNKYIVIHNVRILNLFDSCKDAVDEEQDETIRGPFTISKIKDDQVASSPDPKQVGNSIREEANTLYLLNGSYSVRDPNGNLIICLKQNCSIIELLESLNSFLNNPAFMQFRHAFVDMRTRLAVKLAINKALDILSRKLLAENLDPIVIQINCDKNKYPDIITSLKDNRNQAQNATELIEQKDHVFFTPNFLAMFDLKGYRDSSYLRTLCKFNAIQLGFRVHDVYSFKREKINQHR